MKWLKEVVRGAPKTNKGRIDTIISLYEGGVIGNVKTAENILERLASKSARKIYTDKTDKIFNKLVKEAPLLKDFNILSGKRKPDAKLKKVMVTMLLHKEKEDEKAEKLREKTGTDIPVHVDFPKGTSVASALEQQEDLREIGYKFIGGSPTVNETDNSRGKERKPLSTPSDLNT